MDGPFYACVSWIVIIRIIFEVHTMRIVFEHHMLTAKFRPFAFPCYCSEDCFFIISTTICAWENCITANSNLSKKDDKMMQLRLHTLNRHRSKCLVDIILKAYNISKSLEICRRWLASYLDYLQCKYCELQGVFFFVEK